MPASFQFLGRRRQSLGCSPASIWVWSPCGECPLPTLSSGPPFSTPGVACNTHPVHVKKTQVKTFSQQSCLVSLRGAASRRLPLGCREEGTCQAERARLGLQAQKRAPTAIATLLDPRTGTRGIYLVEEACADVFNDIPIDPQHQGRRSLSSRS